MNEKLKIGVLGLSRGLVAARIVRRFSSKVQIAKVCDLRQDLAERTAKELDADVSPDFETLLKDPSIDAVYVATPLPNHAKHCAQVLRAGKHVLSEVTVLSNLQDAEDLLKAEKESGKRYMLAENYCYLKAWNMVMKMVREGLFGEIYYAEGDYMMNFHERPGFPYIGGWRQNIYHMHRGHVYITHSLGPLMQAFGYEPLERVSCMGCGSYPHEVGLRADNTCNLLLQTRSEKLIRLRQDFLSWRPDNYLFYAIQGTRGVYEGGRSYPGAYHEGDRREIQESSQKINLRSRCCANEWIDLFSMSEYLPDMNEGWLPDEAIREFGVYNEGVGVMFNDFADAVSGRKTLELSLRRAMNWTAAGLLSEESADKRGVPVDIPDYMEC